MRAAPYAFALVGGTVVLLAVGTVALAVLTRLAEWADGALAEYPTTEPVPHLSVVGVESRSTRHATCGFCR